MLSQFLNHLALSLHPSFPLSSFVTLFKKSLPTTRKLTLINYPIFQLITKNEDGNLQI
jgi:hypothetical protein